MVEYFRIVAFFCYISSFLSRDFNDDEDVKARIDKAGDAFGSLRMPVFSNASICSEEKKIVLEG